MKKALVVVTGIVLLPLLGLTIWSLAQEEKEYGAVSQLFKDGYRRLTRRPRNGFAQPH